MRVTAAVANGVLTGGEQPSHPLGRFRVGLREQVGAPVEHRARVVA